MFFFVAIEYFSPILAGVMEVGELEGGGGGGGEGALASQIIAWGAQGTTHYAGSSIKLHWEPFV